MIDPEIYNIFTDLKGNYTNTFTATAAINEDLVDKLCCDCIDIYFVSQNAFDNADLKELDSRIILIPHYGCEDNMLYKVVDEDFKLYIYKSIKNDLNKYRGKKNI